MEVPLPLCLLPLLSMPAPKNTLPTVQLFPQEMQKDRWRERQREMGATSNKSLQYLPNLKVMICGVNNDLKQKEKNKGICNLKI